MKQKYNDLRTYFLPYQLAWLNNDSIIKLWEKSRQIGATYIQAFEDVMDCIEEKVPGVWFSSADITASKEYIDYCALWAETLEIVAGNVGEEIIDLEKGITAYTLKFENGTKIHALSSNPKGLRSKKGKLVLDEFAHHDHPDEMWKAAFPITTWGYPIRILSTHNGKSCKFYRFIEDIASGKLDWFHQKIDIYEAVRQGLADKILGRKLKEKERKDWINGQKKLCGDTITWQQEYECIPVDESTAFLTYEDIYKCEKNDILISLEDITNDLYIGVDIGRKKHLTVIWGIEKIGNLKITRLYKVLENMPFQNQEEILFKILSHPKMRRCCIDNTGLGMQLAEDAQIEFGKYKVEPITFTSKNKEELAYSLKRSVDDNSIFVPNDFDIREDLHSVKKIVSLSGNIRFDVAKSDASGHADRFWSLALSNFAVTDYKGPPIVSSRRKRAAYELTKNYGD